MLIRSEMQYADVEYPIKYSPNVTIDIEFTGIHFISIPNSFDGIKIKRIENRYIFNDNPNHFLEASSGIIGVSKWDHTKSRFDDLRLEYDEVIAKL